MGVIGTAIRASVSLLSPISMSFNETMDSDANPTLCCEIKKPNYFNNKMQQKIKPVQAALFCLWLLTQIFFNWTQILRVFFIL